MTLELGTAIVNLDLDSVVTLVRKAGMDARGIDRSFGDWHRIDIIPTTLEQYAHLGNPGIMGTDLTAEEIINFRKQYRELIVQKTINFCEDVAWIGTKYETSIECGLHDSQLLRKLAKQIKTGISIDSTLLQQIENRRYLSGPASTHIIVRAEKSKYGRYETWGKRILNFLNSL